MLRTAWSKDARNWSLERSALPGHSGCTASMMLMTLLVERLVCSVNCVCSSTHLFGISLRQYTLSVVSLIFLAEVYFWSLQIKCWNFMFTYSSLIVTDLLGQVTDLPSMEALVCTPIPLSYYIASKLPLQDRIRQELLEMESTVNRLKCEIQLLERMDKLKCNRCWVCLFCTVSCPVCHDGVDCVQHAWLVSVL
jgi:hypothetical protein